MSRCHIVAAVLLVAGSAAVYALHHQRITAEITPRPLLYLVADTERELERIPLELTRVSDEEEMRVGEELARRFGYATGRSTDAESQRIEQYLGEVGARVAVHVNRKAIRYDFHYVPTNSFINATALPGGQIVFGRGLLRLLESEDELGAILGHEIAHVDQRHAIGRLQYEVKSRKLGLEGLYRISSLGVALFQAGYTKEQELEADRIGLALSVAAGYSPGGAVDAMQRLAKLREVSTHKPGSPIEEMADVPVQALQEYFRSHPPVAERIAAFEAEIAAHRWNANQAQRPLAVRAIFLAESAAELDRRGEFDKAIARYNEAIAADEKYLPARHGLARAIWRSGEAAAAATAAAEALSRDTDALPVWELLAKALAASDRTGAAARFQQILKKTPPASESVRDHLEAESLGLRVYSGERADQALTAYGKIIEKEPDRRVGAYLRCRMGWWLYRVGNLKKAAEELEAARQAYPQDWPTRLALAWVLTDLGRQADAQEQLRGTDSSSFTMESQALAGVIYWRSDRRDQAKAAIARAAAKDEVWLEPHWAANNYSPAAAVVLGELRTAEIAHRKEEELRAQRAGQTPAASRSPR
ncbi:MAG: M48 family metalloprotease [Acidobacteria bacterium]|nr:M48 family metalloprotease [Acidobacteriota bacterium]